MTRAWRTRNCASCKAVYLSYPGDPRECHKCRGKVETVTIEVSPDELKRLKALATLRGVSVAEIARVALSEYAATRVGANASEPV